MFKKILEYQGKPELYAESSSKFWDDENISKYMLEAHLNSEWEAASRKHKFIEESVDWINKVAPSNQYPDILDLGCGPGLYAVCLHKKGYNVTGIDYSKRSIEYAKEVAMKNQFKINYIYQNYLEIDYDQQYDIIILIYCDFACLSFENRSELLKRIYKALKPGGKLIFDVFTINEYANQKESHYWYLNEGPGFWKDKTHLCLESKYIYEKNMQLDQYIVIDEEYHVEVYRVWNVGYTKETLINEVAPIGFMKMEIFSDVRGKPFEEQSNTLCIILEKKK